MHLTNSSNGLSKPSLKLLRNYVPALPAAVLGAKCPRSVDESLKFFVLHTKRINEETGSETINLNIQEIFSVKIISIIALSIIISACGTTSHYGKRPDFSSINIGMPQKEVIEQLGKPDDMAAKNGTVYLNYIYTPWYDHNGADGNAEHYFVRLVNNKVDSFGRRGDFDSIKNPEQTINVNIQEQ